MLRLRLAARQFAAVVSLTAICVAQQASSALQDAAHRAMARQRGTIVVLDVQSGRVLASSHLEVAARRVAAPGSSIKPFTLMALLESGKFNPRTALACRRVVSIGGHELNCSHPVTSDPLNASQALAYSCNSYFTTVALRISPAELQTSLVRAGFSAATGLAPDEATGTVLLAQSSEELQLQAVGEWGIHVTPLEVANAYRRLAQLQRKHEAKLEPLFAGLEQSATYGMARNAQAASGAQVAGKTGTAASDESAWTHAWFAGYAPANNPEIVVAVFLEKGHGGSEAAAVARQVFEAFATTQTSRSAAGGKP